MLVQKLEIYFDHFRESAVVEITTLDAQGRPVDPVSSNVPKEFAMSIFDLFNAQQHASIVALTAERSELIASNTALHTQLATLTAELNTLRSQNAIIPTLQSRLALLPWNPRWISPSKFVERFSALQTRMVYESTEPTLVGGRQLLTEYVTQNYQVELDDPQVTGLIDYMVAMGILTQSDRANILRDSTSDERYQPTVA